jgi:hypothetical protein
VAGGHARRCAERLRDEVRHADRVSNRCRECECDGQCLEHDGVLLVETPPPAVGRSEGARSGGEVLARHDEPVLGLDFGARLGHALVAEVPCETLGGAHLRARESVLVVDRHNRFLRPLLEVINIERVIEIGSHHLDGRYLDALLVAGAESAISTVSMGSPRSHASTQARADWCGILDSFVAVVIPISLLKPRRPWNSTTER